MPQEPYYSITPLETLRHFGAFKALQFVILKGLRIRSVVVIARSPALQDWGLQEQHDIRRATADDAGLFEAAGFSRDTLLQKLEEGPGWISIADGRLQGWNFLGTKHSLIADWLLLRSDKPGGIWGTGTWVSRDQRGLGLARRMRGVAGVWCNSEGYDELMGWIELTNYSSRRSSQKTGAKTIACVTFLRVFGVALVHDGGQWHLGRWTASRPLALSIDAIRRDRASHDAGYENPGVQAAAPRPSTPPGRKESPSRSR